MVYELLTMSNLIQAFQKNPLFKSVKFVTQTVVAASLVCTVASVQADDTEVFFGSINSSQQIKPNILFALDTSGSMNEGTDDVTGGTEKRITRMKQALHGILGGITNLNVGLMRFNGAEGGGSILYPVSDIENQLCVDNCGSFSDLSRISFAADDVEQETESGTVFDSGNILSIGLPSHDGAAQQAVGLRFDGLDIPSGAVIESASLVFTAQQDSDVPTTIDIYIEDADDSRELETDDFDLTNRAKSAATQGWTANNWETDGMYETPDISHLLQSVVDRNGWCGGNAMTFILEGNGRRDAVSADNDANEAPALKITYNADTLAPGKGCVTGTAISQVSQSSDDAYEWPSTNVNTSNRNLFVARRNDSFLTVGVRFQGVNIPAGAEISKAYIEFEADDYRTGNTHLEIRGQASDNPAQFVSVRRNIRDRARTTSSVAWINPPEVARNEKIQTPDLKDIVQEIVNRGGWQPENSMAFMINRISGTGFREFESFDGEPSNAPTLVVEYKNATFSGLTVRDHLIEQVDKLQVTGGTPILDVLYEANRYFTGGAVDYGRTRGNKAINHDMYPDQRHSYHRVSHPESLSSGVVNPLSFCSGWGGDEWRCRFQTLGDNPVYKSPVADSCQSNHIVLLSDGVPTWNSAQEKVKSRLNVSSCEHGGQLECIEEFVNWMATEDQLPGLPDDQKISTYTIGFGKPEDLQFLEDVAKAGEGEFFEAITAGELQEAFERILADVLDLDTTFVAPGATVNQFNRLTHRNDIYFSLFSPADNPLWGGNLKKYRIKTLSPTEVKIVDVNDEPAVDPSTGFFSASSTSLWSDVQDGTDVERGGAAGEIRVAGPGNSNPRKVYTYVGPDSTNDIDLTTAANAFHEDNTALNKTVLEIGTQSNEYRENLIRWSRGLDVFDEDSDGDKTDARLHLGDPMHSRPLILNYSDGNDNFSSVVYVATNEGFLHAIDHEDGSEKYAYIPQELLGNLDDFFQGNSTTPHPYGLDGDISSWFDDKNNNTVIDPGEDAYLFVGMRRGGNNYYALDISDVSKPKLKWVIRGGNGGTPGYEELAQTWSKANVATMRINGVDAHPVLVFGGGYAINQDDTRNVPTQPTRIDNEGRALFIADVKTGEKLWSATPNNTGAGADHLHMPEMQYSIPGNIRVLDIDFDGNADQMYASDMGGQIWRFDINNSGNSEPFVRGGVMADLSGTDAEDARRFYYEPDVSLISKDGLRFLSIAIGSGWRAHPLDDVIQDRLYMLRIEDVYGAPPDYGRIVGSGASATWQPITEADLLDVTNDVNPLASDILAKNGWMIRLEEQGEKALSETVTINNQLLFTTYLPAGDGGPCQPAAGSGAIYVLDVFDGSPTINLSSTGGDDGAALNKDDRSRILKHGGIPPSAAALISEEGVPVVLVGPEQPLDELDFGQLTKKTWWQEVHNDE